MDQNVTRNLSARDFAHAAEEPGERESGVRECGHEEESDPSSIIYESLGPYRLLEALGSGAMGHIYRARHVVLERMVAIKVLRPELADDETHVERFVAEARAVNLLQHPHVIDVMDIGVGPEPQCTPWFVMELLEGVDLARLLTPEGMDIVRALQIVRQVCEALEAIHAAGIVHRDIKPENIFLTQRDGADFVKLIDFGVARLRGPFVVANEGKRDNLIGTPRYMAPEQIGDHPIDHRADLYAVGSVLFELISGAPPFDADDLTELLRQVMVKRPPRLSSSVTLPAAVRDDLDHLLDHCLQKRPCDRPESAREVIECIDEIAARLASDARLTDAVALVHGRPTPIAEADLMPVEPRRGSGLSFVFGGALAVMGLCVGARLGLDEAAPPGFAVQASLGPAPTARVSEPSLAEPVAEPVAGPVAETVAETAAEPAAEPVAETVEPPAAEEQVLVGVEIPSALDLSPAQEERRLNRMARRRARAELAGAPPILTVTPAPEAVAAPPAEPLDRDGVLDPFQ